MSHEQHLPGPSDLPAVVIGHVRHARRGPIRHAFRHRTYLWLVDVDHLPRPGGWRRLVCRFDARDHLDAGRLGGGLRGDVERFCAARGVRVEPTDRVVMLAHARELGHVFDPLSIFWVVGVDGAVRAVVMEVHNTYRERHAYLLAREPGAATTRADLDKAFYVSPFNDTSGSYRVGLSLDRTRLALGISLRRDGAVVFDASIAGDVVPAAEGLPRALRWAPLAAWRTSALIRVHGIWLWARRLPVQPRRPHRRDDAVR